MTSPTSIQASNTIQERFSKADPVPSKKFPIAVREKDGLPPIATAHDVINGTGIFEADGTRHG